MGQAGVDGGHDVVGGDAGTAGRLDETKQPEPQGLRGAVVLALSPHAGHAGDSNAAVRALRAAGVEVGEQLVVSALDGAPPRGPEWLAKGYCAAVAAGGDGSIGTVASHLAGSTLPLGILPLGTSNDIARSLGIPLSLDEAAQVIAAGRAVAIDAGRAVPAQTAPLATTGDEVETTPALGAYFLHALTLGFNAQFARLATDVARRARLGGLNYATALMQALTTYRPVAVTLRFEGLVEPVGVGELTVIARDAVQVAVVNTPVFGGALNLRVPGVGMRDQLLDFVLIEALDPQQVRATVEDALAALARLPERLPPLTTRQQSEPHVTRRSDAELGLALPGLHRYKARAAVIESARPLDVTLDGEVRAQTPVHVRVAPQPALVLLPAGSPVATHEG